MQDRDSSYFESHEWIRRGDQGNARQEQSLVTRIPNQTSDENYLVSSPRQEVYQQALRVMLENPQIERRLNYITAGMIVTILGGWLTGSVVKSRAFSTFTGILLFFCGTALVGLLVGTMLGAGLLPKESVPILLFAMLGILILVLAVLLGSLLLQSTQVD